MTWLTNACLSIVVVGASGDLAKKKTYPSLLNLFVDRLLPKNTKIIGYARSNMSDDDLHGRLRPFLQKSSHSEDNIENFLKICFYQGGESYGDVDAFGNLKTTMETFEEEKSEVKEANRLFYFAIPPNVFGETAVAIKKTCMQAEGAIGRVDLSYCASCFVASIISHQSLPCIPVDTRKRVDTSYCGETLWPRSGVVRGTEQNPVGTLYGRPLVSY